jgi:hypothetical protein
MNKYVYSYSKIIQGNGYRDDGEEVLGVAEDEYERRKRGGQTNPEDESV